MSTTFTQMHTETTRVFLRRNASKPACHAYDFVSITDECGNRCDFFLPPGGADALARQIEFAADFETTTETA